MKTGRPPQDPARLLERAHRILDAAGELVLRWGYDKTTVDDVAQAAGVAKGTVYLHWRTRDALFAALLRRERVTMLAQVRRDGPRTPRDLLRALALGILERPLLKASMLGDSQVLGKLTRNKRVGDGNSDGHRAFTTYLALLREHGAVRDDLTPAEHLTALLSTLYGFLMVPRYLPDGDRLPDARLAELLADTADRAMSAGRPLPAEAAAAVARATEGLLGAAVAAAERKLALSLGSPESAS